MMMRPRHGERSTTHRFVPPTRTGPSSTARPTERRVRRWPSAMPRTGACCGWASGRVFQTADSLRRDRVNQLAHVTFHFEELTAARGLNFAIRFTARWIYKGEFALLLQAAGFERWQVCGGFNGEPLLRDDQEMVW